MIEELSLPDSVRDYLQDPAIRFAVDALLALRPDKMPPDLELHELPTYLAARSAAEMTRYEFAATSYQLWSAVWAPLLEDWEPARFDELMANAMAVSPTQCWEEKGFNIWHRRDGRYLYTAVAIAPKSTSIAISLEDDVKVLTETASNFVWTESDDWNGWLVHEQAGGLADDDFDLARLRNTAAAAYQQVSVVAG